ncbi:MAG: BatD family protein [bacterium]
MKKWLLILVVLNLSASFLMAQDVKFVATATKTAVSEGERFQVTYTLYNAQGTRLTPPNFKDFTVLMGPSMSQSTQIINGAMSQQVSYSYVLQSNKIGTYTVGPATITVNGNPIQSNSLTINVLEPSQAEKQQREQVKQEEKSLSQQAKDVIAENLFVTLSVNKSNVYVGEQIIATYKIYVHPELNVQNLTPNKEPAFNGFWTQQIDLGNVQWQNESYKGKTFRSAVIKKVILLPQQSGKLEIEPYLFDCIARLRVQGQQQRRRHSVFDDFFDDPFFSGGGYRDFPYVASSSREFINVKPLPKPQPEDFNGGVGKITLDAWIDKPKTKAGEPISLKIKIGGSGNLKLIEPMEMNFPPDFEVYDPKIADNVIVSANGISGHKVFEYLMIPKHEGEYKIDPVHFSFFDLDKKTYVSLSSNEFTISVSKGDGNETAVISGIQKEDIKFLGKDIRFIKSEKNLSNNGERLFGSTGFILFSFLPLFLFFFLIFYKKRRYELVSNEKLMKNRRATKVARKRLTAAKKYLTAKDKNKFYEEIEKALWYYVSDKLSIPVSELTKDTASKALEKKNIPIEVISEYLNTVDHSEFERFAPATDDYGMDKTYSDAVRVITKLEGILK